MLIVYQPSLAKRNYIEFVGFQHNSELLVRLIGNLCVRYRCIFDISCVSLCDNYFYAEWLFRLLQLSQNLNFSCCRMEVQYVHNSNGSIQTIYLKHFDSVMIAAFDLTHFKTVLRLWLHQTVLSQTFRKYFDQISSTTIVTNKNWLTSHTDQK